jgi:putative Mg2+ transporter-C (MgtC) family protein
MRLVMSRATISRVPPPAYNSRVVLAGLLRQWMPSANEVWSSLWEALVCLGTAVLCGLIVGLEREKLQKAAGLRTHILVCLGAAAFVHLGAVAHSLGGFGSVADFNRLIQSVATGIGFLGAGAIFRDRVAVRGVTTAASIWIMGAVGAAAGAGNIPFAFILSLFAYVVLRWLRILAPDETHEEVAD